ncbi:MAG: TlpA disulfide reductase family protein [Myxococcota bacterium]
MIATVLTAWLGGIAVFMAPPPDSTPDSTPVDPADTPARPSFTLHVGAGLGLGMRRPTWSGDAAQSSIRSSLAAQVWARPFLDLPVGPGLAIQIPLSYASTIGAVVREQGPGIDREREIRSHQLAVAVDGMAALGPSKVHRVWLGGGITSSYTALDSTVSATEPHHGFDLLGVRVPMVASLARGAVILDAAPALGVVFTGPRARAAGLGRVGLGLDLSAGAHVRLLRWLAVTVRYREQNVRWPGQSDARVDRGRTLTAGLSIVAGGGATGKTPAKDRSPRKSGSMRTDPPASPAPAETASDPASDRPPGPPAPALTGTTLDGAAIDLTSLQGQVVVVDFWASWCDPCREAMPHLQALQDALGSRGLVVIGVSVDETEDEARAFAKSAGIEFSIVHDADQGIAQAWQPPKMPTTFVIDRDGTIAATFAGYTPAEGERLRAEVERLVGAP